MARSRPLLCTRMLAVLAAIAVAGCGPSRDTVESARVLRAVDAVREAPNAPVAPRQQLLDALAADPATSALAARARDACVKAYKPLLEGNALTERVRTKMLAPDRNQEELSRNLVDAEARIDESRAAMPDCDRAVADLRRRTRR